MKINLNVNMMKNLLVFCSAIFLISCATLNEPASVKPEISNTLNSPLAIAVIDHRPYVLSGDKEATFEGLLRALVGIPYSKPTGNNQTLSNYIGTILNTGIAATHSDVTLVSTLHTDSNSELEKLLLESANNYLYLELVELKYDFHGFSARVFYDVNVTYFEGSTGNKIAKNFNGDEAISKVSAGGENAIRNNVQQAYKTIIESMLNDSVFQ